MNSPEQCLCRVDVEIERTKLFAQYWLAMATTGATTRRQVTRGDGHRLTAEDLIDDALNTALTHIHRLEELAESRVKLVGEMQAKPQDKFVTGRTSPYDLAAIGKIRRGLR